MDTAPRAGWAVHAMHSYFLCGMEPSVTYNIHFTDCCCQPLPALKHQVHCASPLSFMGTPAMTRTLSRHLPHHSRRSQQTIQCHFACSTCYICAILFLQVFMKCSLPAAFVCIRCRKDDAESASLVRLTALCCVLHRSCWGWPAVTRAHEHTGTRLHGRTGALA